jgi:uncharacterized protein (DUF305 family)
MKRPLAALAATTLVLTLGLSACGSDDAGSGGMSDHSGMGGMHDSDSTDSAESHNDADATFVQSMIPHHEQAVMMAGLAADRASSPEVKDLASRIEAAQGPEIDTMKGWLEDWGVEPMTGHMSGMHDDMPGMMSDADMSALRKAQGADFDRQFLTMMIAHHEGAIEMARTELEDGEDADVKALATSIERAQTKEIAEMRQLLQS